MLLTPSTRHNLYMANDSLSRARGEPSWIVSLMRKRCEILSNALSRSRRVEDTPIAMP